MNCVIGIADKKDNQFKMLCRDKFSEAIDALVEGRYSVEIKKVYNKGSAKQNRATWGIPYKLLQQCFINSTGEYVDSNWVHEFCKERFLPGEYVERIKKEHEEDPKNHIVNEKTGEEITIPFRLTTSKMTTVEKIEYYKELQRFGAEFFYCEIPDPDPNWKESK
jgi:hypothetical protein